MNYLISRSKLILFVSILTKKTFIIKRQTCRCFIGGKVSLCLWGDNMRTDND